MTGHIRLAAMGSLVVVALLAVTGSTVAAETVGEDNSTVLDAETVPDHPSGTFDVAVEPADGEAAPGEVTTYEVVVSGATNGIGAYGNIRLVVDDPSVAQFVNFTETAENNEGSGGILSNSEIRDGSGETAEEGPVVLLKAALLDKAFDGADEIVVAEVQTEALGDAGDTTDVTVEESGVDGEPTIQNAAGHFQVADQRVPAEFTVTNLAVDIAGTNIPAAGEDVDAEVTVENIGDTEVTDEITLSSPALGEVSTTVTLAGGDSTTETLSLSTADGDAGEYTLTAESDHSADSTDATVLSESGFAVDIVETSERVEGETISATVVVENTADSQDTQTVNLTTPLGEASTTVTLAGGESTTETLSVPTEVGDSGEYTLTVATGDDSDSTDVTVLAAATFEATVTDIVAPGTALVEGETITVDYYIQNTGGVQDTKNVTVSIDGTVVKTGPETLTAGGVDSNRLEYTTETGDAPALELAVETPDDSVTETVPVFEPAVLSDLDIAGQGDSAVILPSETRNVTATVTNVGNATRPVDVTIAIGVEAFSSPPVTTNVTTAPLAPGESTQVTFEDIAGGVPAPVFNYTVEVFEGTSSVTGGYAVWPDVTGDGNPATDTTGDSLLNDVDGDGTFDIFDVQMLFDNLGTESVQLYSALFDFAGVDDDRVSIFDIQGLYTQLRNPPT